MEGYTPDNNPVIGKHPNMDDVYICTGFSGHGFKLSPAIGKLTSQLLLEEELNHNLDDFSPNRFMGKEVTV
jgi:sarcosine oxidase